MKTNAENQNLKRDASCATSWNIWTKITRPKVIGPCRFPPVKDRQRRKQKPRHEDEDADYVRVPIPDTPTKQKQIGFTKFPDILFSTTARYLVKGILPSAGLVVVWGPPNAARVSLCSTWSRMLRRTGLS